MHTRTAIDTRAWAALGTIMVLIGLPVPAPAGQNQPPRRIDVAPGVHVFVTPPYGDVGLDGNSVVIEGSTGLLVFDTNGTPAAARAVLGEIRRLTDKPVRYVVNSHWHWDHWYGTEVYTDAFPGVVVIAQERGRRMMAGPAIEWNRPGLERDLPGYVSFLEKKRGETDAAGQTAADPARREMLRDQIETARFFLEQKRGVRHQLPTLTFDTRLTVYLGDRVVEVRNEGPAVTPGDAYLYLPKEQLLVTGDLLVNPVSFALSCYPSGWLKTLRVLEGLEARILIPGHGQPLHDRQLLHDTIEVFERLQEAARSGRARGLEADAVKAEVLPGLEPLRQRMTAGDPAAYQTFPIYLVDWYLHRVYDELAGPLDDRIAPIPKE